MEWIKRERTRNMIFLQEKEVEGRVSFKDDTLIVSGEPIPDVFSAGGFD